MHTFDDIIPPSRRKEVEGPVNTGGGASRRSKFPLITVVVVIVIIAASIGALIYFSSAEVDVTPNTVSAAVQSSFTATKSGTLPFEIITAQKTATQSVAGSGTKAVNSSASGTITIYNTQSAAQRLITNTRFATSAGLVFRIHSAITVPGGSTAKPGSISAKVYADKPGSAYNIGPSSFTVPGFAGTPQATQVYARSTAAMTGGASGTVPVVDAALETKTKNALIAALEPDLATSIQAQIPEGYVLLPGAATTTYEELAATPSSTSGMVDIKEQGTITAVVFPNAALAAAIADSVADLGYNGEALTLSSVKNLLLATASGIPSADASSFSFTVAGTAPLIYTIDSARIAAAVAGETRLAAKVALSNYPEVKSAVIILRPFWRQTFPEDPASIKIVVNKAAD